MSHSDDTSAPQPSHQQDALELFPDRGRRPWGFLVAIVIVALIELGVSVAPIANVDAVELKENRLYPSDRAPSDLESMIYWQYMQMLDPQHRDVDVVIFGDSSVMMGVIPETIEESVPASTVNLGLIAWTSVDGHRSILELFVETHGAPSVVVYQASTTLFSQSDEYVEDRGVWSQMRQWLGERGEVWYENWPSYRLRLRARGLLTPSEYTDEFLTVPSSMGTDHEIRDELIRNRGFIFDGRPWETWRSSVPTSPNLHEDMASQFEDLFAYANEVGFELLVIHAPVPETFVSDSFFNSTADIYHQLEAMASEHEHVHVMMPFFRTYPEDHFVNFEHLQIFGAERNSRELADVIRPYLED